VLHSQMSYIRIKIKSTGDGAMSLDVSALSCEGK